jgi:hypothetical protein
MHYGFGLEASAQSFSNQEISLNPRIGTRKARRRNAAATPVSLEASIGLALKDARLAKPGVGDLSDPCPRHNARSSIRPIAPEPQTM